MTTDIKTVKLTLALPPRALGNVNKVIEQRLNGMISQYLTEVEGVLIKWSDLVKLNDHGIIIDDQPYVFWKIAFTAQVFKPIVGKLVKGVVQRIQKHYIITKAMNAFTVTVSIPETYLEHDIIKNLKIEQEVYFRIKYSSDGVYRGEIDEECLEMVDELIKQEEEMDVEGNAYAYAKDFEY